ncbi:ATP-binding protein [Pseudofrankia inefficax]|uniref:ATP-binding protein n=1 Tax=Pseudofrankia inefficax (strain DSM 45817 / CECT 9037 / DDB 130130 / EuI1c) TaxID=298654 RepID=UPI001E41E8B5|nr:ATP-binding protein [Pseudofrankia inefficax]
MARLSPCDAAVPVVRAQAVATLTAWSVDSQAVEVAELVVSELVTNSVRASRPRDEFVAVRLSTTSGCVLVEVWSRPDTTLPTAQHPDGDSESGRGLCLVEALTDRWGSYRATSGGIVVWAQFPGAVVPVQRLHDEQPLPARTARPVPEPRVAPARAPGLPDITFSTDPAVLARTAERLRALDAWHHHPVPC